MSKKCPNKSTKEWKYAESQLGELGAYTAWLVNKEELPTKEQVDATVITRDAKIKATTDEINILLENSTKATLLKDSYDKNGKLVTEGGYKILDKLFKRVSNFLKKQIVFSDAKSVTNLKNAAVVGNYIDMVSRMFFANPDITLNDIKTEIKTSEKDVDGFTNLLTDDVFNDILRNLKQVKEDLYIKHGKRAQFFTGEMLLTFETKEKIDGKFDGVAGTMDMVVIDENGVAHIYDFKNKTGKDASDVSRKIESTAFGKSDTVKWGEQLSLYSDLFYQRSGIEIKTINTIVFPTLYNREEFTGNFTDMNEVEAFEANPSPKTNTLLSGQAVIKSVPYIKSESFEKLSTRPTALEARAERMAKNQRESAFERQYAFFKRRIAVIRKSLGKMTKEGSEYFEKIAELDRLQEKLETANEEQSHEMFIELGKTVLDSAEGFIQKLEQGDKSVTKKNILFVINTLATFNDFEGLSDKSKELFRRAYPFLSKQALESINKYATEKGGITQEMIDKQVADIGTFTASVGALADLANYIARTIGSVIKAAQNRASTMNKKLLSEVQIEVNKLKEYAKANNKTLEEVYNMFITETEDNIKMIANTIKVDGEWVANRDFKVISDNPTLLGFYNFYQKLMSESEANLPIKVGKNYIPNIHKTDVKYQLTHLIDKHEIKFDQFKSNEELYADIVPEQFRGKIPKDKKSRDLGASLLEFAAYSNTFHELSEALPEARLLQAQLEWKQTAQGHVTKREFTKSSDASKRINFEHSNLSKMVSKVIDMQLKGEMAKKEGAWKVKEIKDAEGNVIGYEQVYVSDVIDLALKYNSMLRIGFSPVTAIANVLFGDVSNIIESIGGRFFGVKDLASATNIFFSQIDYVKNEKTSEVYKWLEALNPLQELDDYNLGENVKLKKMSTEKLQEYMYAMQKKGELFLQSRTMIAVLIKEGFMDSSGKTTAKGLELLGGKSGITNLEQMSDKIQRLNQMIHGRYSRREAAALQQSVIYRCLIQFRKWIPSALEARFGAKQYDNRLGVEIEGRYRTLWNLVASKEVFTNLLKMSQGKLSPLEMYNMRKNLTELTILAGTILSYAYLTSGSDEERRKKLKNPGIKLALTLIDRVSGDLSFFYNPKNATNIATNAIPLAKTVKDLFKAIGYIPAAFHYGDESDYEYQAGGLKGSNKFWANFNKILIGFKPVQDVYKIFNENSLDEFK